MAITSDSRPAALAEERFRGSALASLVSPVGLASTVRPAPGLRGLPRLKMASANAGSGIPGTTRAPSAGSSGGSRVLDDEYLSYVVATAEAAERYAGRLPHERPRLATAAELDGPVLDLTRVPRCSDREYADPRCPVRPYDPNTPIHWSPGFDLMSGQDIWVPTVMACYGFHVHGAERFVIQISTGQSVHTDPYAAVLGGLLELFERDSIALTWLQKLPLPPVDPAALTPTSRELLDWTERRFLQTQLFDATTDLGVPAVYALQIAPHDDTVRQIIGAGAGRSLGEAAERCLLELLTIRDSYRAEEELPDDYGDFQFLDGSRMMALPKYAHVYDFLTDGLADRRPSTGGPALPQDPKAAVEELLERLAAADMQAVAVDRTSRELRAAGLTAVSVVVPELQPMSLDPLAQFRAHPRLSEAPVRMGFASLPEEEQNPWPQPFA
ncbi:YcaO-like family protein [Kitasatospora sp. NBC_01287]|uniref:YcaO-like family protein n=1 Tax=Kitasatospora sp. NBC_01287 TaxID=2903573 RepID=UPI0022514B93|nr:YcaO-like family protein [Kitasatospora sp. NBC_01287]MCX4748200.1 YcaO-like family protein [Kitasatospora sp. NBC_01287]